MAEVRQADARAGARRRRRGARAARGRNEPAAGRRRRGARGVRRRRRGRDRPRRPAGRQGDLQLLGRRAAPGARAASRRRCASCCRAPARRRSTGTTSCSRNLLGRWPPRSPSRHRDLRRRQAGLAHARGARRATQERRAQAIAARCSSARTEILEANARDLSAGARTDCPRRCSTGSPSTRAGSPGWRRACGRSRRSPTRSAR